MITRDKILSQIETELDYMLGEAPETLSQPAKQAIKDEAMGYATHILAAVSTQELQSTAAYERFAQTTLRDARTRMRQG